MAETFQSAKLVVQASMTETVPVPVTVTESMTAVAKPKTVAVPMAATESMTEPKAVTVTKTQAATVAEATQQPPTVLAGRMAAIHGRIELRSAHRSVKAVTSVPSLAKPKPFAEPQTRPESAQSEAAVSVATVSKARTEVMTSVSMAEAKARAVNMTTVSQAKTRAVQVVAGTVKGTLEMSRCTVKVAGGTGKTRSVILGVMAVRNRRGVVEVAGLQITGVGHTGNRVGPGGDIRNETTRRGIAGQGANQRDSQSQPSPMSDTHGQSLVNMASLPPGVVRNRARRACPRRPVRGRRHPPTKPLATGATMQMEKSSPP